MNAAPTKREVAQESLLRRGVICHRAQDRHRQHEQDAPIPDEDREQRLSGQSPVPIILHDRAGEERTDDGTENRDVGRVGPVVHRPSEYGPAIVLFCGHHHTPLARDRRRGYGPGGVPATAHLEYRAKSSMMGLEMSAVGKQPVRIVGGSCS